MPNWIQSALFVEGVSTVASGLYAILSPRKVYGYLLNPDPLDKSTLATLAAPSTTVTLVQYMGVLFIAIGMPLVLAARETPAAIASRRMACITATIGEMGLIPFLMYKVVFENGGGFDQRMLLLHILGFVPVLGYRTYALFINPTVLDGAKGRKIA